MQSYRANVLGPRVLISFELDNGCKPADLSKALKNRFMIPDDSPIRITYRGGKFDTAFIWVGPTADAIPVLMSSQGNKIAYLEFEEEDTFEEWVEENGLDPAGLNIFSSTEATLNFEAKKMNMVAFRNEVLQVNLLPSQFNRKVIA